MSVESSHAPWLRYWLSHLMAVVAGVGIWQGGPWLWGTPVLLFVLVPIADLVSKLDRQNPAESSQASFMVDLGLFIWVPLQLSLVALFAWRTASGELTGWSFVAAALIVGLTTGAGGINVAHELMHRSDRFARACSEVLMSSVTYTHFCVEHVHGHHRHVATPDDPASSRRGEGLILFWPRTLWGGVRSAWRIESERVKSGRSGRGLADRRVRFALELAALYGLTYAAFGLPGMAAVAAQSLVAILLLETINYIEHYGLQRQRLDNGNYERVRPQHSWNASHRVSNWFLFNLQRHSDHHYKASRPYWKLRHYEDVPQLPFSYPTAFLVALVPPLWRAIMDPRVDAWNERNAAALQ